MSRNLDKRLPANRKSKVTSRKGRVSRNIRNTFGSIVSVVTSRKGRVSRNI